MLVFVYWTFQSKHSSVLLTQTHRWWKWGICPIPTYKHFCAC